MATYSFSITDNVGTVYYSITQTWGCGVPLAPASGDFAPCGGLIPDVLTPEFFIGAGSIDFHVAWSAEADAFSPVPEPGSFGLMALALLIGAFVGAHDTISRARA